MAKKGGNGNGINRLMGQMQQQNTILQGQVQNNALVLAGAQNTAMMSQNGLAQLAIAGNNAQTLTALHGAGNAAKLQF